MKVLYRHYKLTTKRNWHSQGSGPLGSGPIGPGSGYSVMPKSHPSYNACQCKLYLLRDILKFLHMQEFKPNAFVFVLVWWRLAA